MQNNHFFSLSPIPALNVVVNFDSWFVFDCRWITVPQLVNAFYVITKNEIGRCELKRTLIGYFLVIKHSFSKRDQEQKPLL